MINKDLQESDFHRPYLFMPHFHTFQKPTEKNALPKHKIEANHSRNRVSLYPPERTTAEQLIYFSPFITSIAFVA